MPSISGAQEEKLLAVATARMLSDTKQLAAPEAGELAGRLLAALVALLEGGGGSGGEEAGEEGLGEEGEYAGYSAAYARLHNAQRWVGFADMLVVLGAVPGGVMAGGLLEGGGGLACHIFWILCCTAPSCTVTPPTHLPAHRPLPSANHPPTTRPERDPLPDVQDARAAVAQALGKMAAAQPGRVPQLVQASLSAEQQQKLAGYCQAAGVAIA